VTVLLPVSMKLASTMQPNQSTKMAFERATSHIKVTCPLVDSSCHHGKGVNRSMNLINGMCQ